MERFDCQAGEPVGAPPSFATRVKAAGVTPVNQQQLRPFGEAPQATDARMTDLPPNHLRDLERAVGFLEQPRLGIRVANYLGKPINTALKRLPGMNGTVHRALRSAIYRCLTVAIALQGDEAFVPSPWRAKVLTGLSGGMGGLFGVAAMPVELPITLTLMLRGVADIARQNGEDLSSLESRLACLQVFALDDRNSDAGAAIGYYAARAALTKLTADVMANLVERRVLDASAPAVTKMVTEIVSRFGFVLSERAAAGALPVLGAIGGASINVMFTDHFQRLAQGHFTLRRLERAYGTDAVREHYVVVRSRLGRLAPLSPFDFASSQLGAGLDLPGPWTG